MSRRSGALGGLLILALVLAPADRAPATPPAGRAGCGANLAETLATTDGAGELVVVEAPSATSTTAVVERFALVGRCYVGVGGPYPARLGRRGLSTRRHEGDLTTPVGLFGFGPVIYGALADPGLSYPYHRLVCGDWWDEDPASPEYNRFVHVACGRAPPFGSGEALWEELPAYDYFAVIAYNLDPVVAGAGSGIFLHVSTATATAGCVSVSQQALVATLRWLSPTMRPRIAIGTAAELAAL